MYQRPFIWTTAHILLSLLFGILFVAMTGHMLVSMEVAVTWHEWLVALGLVLGNPFFKLVRHRNGIAVLFFGLLAFQDLIVTSQILFIFLVLACVRRRLNDLELHQRDMQLTGKVSPSIAGARNLLSWLQKAIRSVGRMVWQLTKGFFTFTYIAVRLVFVTVIGVTLLFLDSFAHPANNCCGLINPATGWPMQDNFMDIMGNPWGYPTHYSNPSTVQTDFD